MRNIIITAIVTTLVVLGFQLPSVRAYAKATYTQRGLEDYSSHTQYVVKVIHPNSSGTGVCVGKREVLTNAHITAGRSEVEILLSNGDDRTRTAKVVWEDKGSDLALVKVKQILWAKCKPVRITDIRLKAGDPLHMVGNPGGFLINTFSFGRVASTNLRKLLSFFNILVLQVDLTINPGSSGSPIFFGDNMVALASIGPNLDGRPVIGVGFAVPADTICAKLREYKFSHRDC